MDFTTLDTRKKSNEGSFLQLIHPGTGLPLAENGVKIGLHLFGKDSDAFAEATHRRNNKRLGVKSSTQLTSEQIEAEGLELLADLTSGWFGIDGYGEFSREAVIALYKSLPWVKEQADTHIGDRANLF